MDSAAVSNDPPLRQRRVCLPNLDASSGIQSRILEILNQPPMMRCPELGLLIDRASLRELQDIYPVLVNSIFGVNTGGGTGWGFRLMTRDTHPHDFDVLYNFFIPIGGPMFRLCYRLLSDSLKYELPVGMLPVSFYWTEIRVNVL